MRAWILGLLLGAGFVLILVVAGASARDDGDASVRAQAWADDVCGTVGAWEGALKGIRKQLQKSSYGARNSDGGTGDTLEHTVGLRVSLDRAIVATRQTLREGIRRAGVPDSEQGAQSAAAMRRWAVQTQANLLAARARLKQEPRDDSIASEALEALTVPATALARSVAQGRATIQAIAKADPSLGEAFARSGTCRRLQRRTA